MAKVDFLFLRLAKEKKAKLQTEVIKELEVSKQAAMYAAQLAKGYIALRTGCYLKCLICNATIKVKSSCTDHEHLINLFKDPF